METLHSILMKNYEHHIIKERHPQKPKRKKKSESLEAIFRLPKSVLDRFRTGEEVSPLRRERSRNRRLEATVELGDIGQEYQHNLRRTILSHTKEVLNSGRNKSSCHQNNYMLKEEPKTRPGCSSQYDSNMKTLTILQKAIIREDDMFEAEDNLFELQANRLPIIRKRDTRRKQFTVAIERRAAVLDSPPKREAVKEQIAKKSEELKVVLARRREEKAEIRGWDIPEEM